MKFFHHISTPMLAVAAVLGSCCNSHDVVAPQEEEQPIFFSFTMVIPRSGEATRTDDSWGDNYDAIDGDPFESTIDINRFYPIICKVDANGKILGHAAEVEPMLLTRSDNREDIVYRFTGRVWAEDENPSIEELIDENNHYRLMVFANVDMYDRSDAESATFSLIGKASEIGLTSAVDDENAAQREYMPMWGVADLKFRDENNDPILRSGVTVNVGDIDMLRAMAKVRVAFNIQGDERLKANTVLNSITFENANGSGYMVPGNWNAISKTGDLKFSETLHALTSKLTPEYFAVPDMITVESEDGEEPAESVKSNEIIVYIPEAINTKDNEVKMIVNFSVYGLEYDREIRFCRYSGGSASTEAPTDDDALGIENTSGGVTLWNIVRNHVYDYVITGVPNAELTIEARVRAWNYHKSEIEI